jgi:hypothetical protein
VLSYETKGPLLFEASILMHHQKITVMKTYIAADLGGYAFFLFVATGIFISPLTEFIYYLKAIEQLFLVRTRDRTIFKDSKKFKALPFQK